MTGQPRRRSETYRGEWHRGVTTIEFAIVFPVILLLLLGLIEFGRAIWSQTTLNYAVQSAARCGAINTKDCGTVAQIQHVAVLNAPGLPVTATNFTVTTPACGVRVAGSMSFQFVVPALLPYSITLASVACFPVAPAS